MNFLAANAFLFSVLYLAVFAHTPETERSCCFASSGYENVWNPCETGLRYSCAIGKKSLRKSYLPYTKPLLKKSNKKFNYNLPEQVIQLNDRTWFSFDQLIHITVIRLAQFPSL